MTIYLAHMVSAGIHNNLTNLCKGYLRDSSKIELAFYCSHHQDSNLLEGQDLCLFPNLFYIPDLECIYHILDDALSLTVNIKIKADKNVNLGYIEDAVIAQLSYDGFSERGKVDVNVQRKSLKFGRNYICMEKLLQCLIILNPNLIIIRKEWILPF